MEREEQFRDYLEGFLTQGSSFNGTNIWLSNLSKYDEFVFAHNQDEKGNFIVLDQDEFYAFGTGDVAQEWEK